MATMQSMKNELAAKKPQAPKSIKDYVKMYEGEIAKALPKVMTPERFTRIVLTAITQTPKLAGCTPQSFVGAMLQSAQLGLEPNTPLGHAYLIPYNGKCQFQLGYKGMIELAHRSGEIKDISAHIVYQNDTFEFEYGLEPRLIHKPAMKDKGAMVWVYAVYHTVNGGYGFEVMSADDVIAHGRKYSKTYDNGPWQTDFEEMAKKTVLKKVLKYAPLKTEFVTADESVIELDSSGDLQIVDYGEDYVTVDENGEAVQTSEGAANAE